MDSNLFTLNGYGQFVWPAFVFTFASCLILYLKTKQELKKQEKIFFSEYNKLKEETIEIVEDKKSIQETFSTNSI